MNKFSFILFWCISLHAHNGQELFLQANQLYTAQDFQKALQMYEKISHKGAAVWYNMGNCAYKMGEYTKALAYWQHAARVGSSSIANDSAYNSNVVLQKLPHVRVATSLFNRLPLLLVQILFLCMCSFFIVITLYAHRRKKVLLVLGIIVIASGFFTGIVFTMHTGKKAIILHTQTPLYAGPTTDYHELMRLEQGVIVTIKEQNSSWAKIQWNNHSGWIMKQEILGI